MSEELIKSQRSLINALERANARLKEENRLLKATLKEVSEQWHIALPESIDLAEDVKEQGVAFWGEKYERFGGIRRLLLETTIDVCRVEKNAVHQDIIISEFRRRHPQVVRRISSAEDTLFRRLRELREEGWLSSPVQAHFFPTPKCFEGR